MLNRNLRAAAAIAVLAATCPVTAAVSSATGRLVYVCRNASPVAFSDLPCGPISQARLLVVPDPAAGRAPTLEPAPPGETTLPRTSRRVVDGSAAAQPVAADTRCRQLREESELLDDRMRAGYPAREAAQLWNRWREVGAKIHAARC